MCGRYTLTQPGDALADLHAEGVLPEELLQPRYNIAPTHVVPVARLRPDHTELVAMTWGFSAPLGGGKERLLINARSETAPDKPSFREAFSERRCFLPADGFYEWRRNGKLRNAFHFHTPDRRPFFFAGLWQASRGRDALDRCLILTTAANSVTREVHDRMPVILNRRQGEAWLADADEQRHLALLQPLGDDQIVRTPVGQEVNKVANDGPTLIEPERHVENLSLF